MFQEICLHFNEGRFKILVIKKFVETYYIIKKVYFLHTTLINNLAAINECQKKK